MIRCVVAFLTVGALLAGSARADTIRIGKLPYPGVRIEGLEGQDVLFAVAGGRTLRKPLEEVAAIAVTGKDDLNKAEELLEANKPGEAVAAYDRAIQGESGWLERLIRFRRLAALGKSTNVDRAVEEWLNLLAEPGPTAFLLKLRPGVFGPKGSPQNAGAISLLEARKDAFKDNKAVSGAIDDLLLALYQQEGKTEEAASLAGRIAAHSGPVAPVAGTGPAPAVDKAAGTQLRALEVLIGQGKAEEVLKEIQANLAANRYSVDDQPRALWISGKARRKLAEAATGIDQRKRLIEAGLDFMRVVAFFASSPEAPEALLAAGQVNAELGNPWAATNALEGVVQRYPDSDAAKTAATELEKRKASAGP